PPPVREPSEIGFLHPVSPLLRHHSSLNVQVPSDVLWQLPHSRHFSLREQVDFGDRDDCACQFWRASRFWLAKTNKARMKASSKTVIDRTGKGKERTAESGGGGRRSGLPRCRTTRRATRARGQFWPCTQSSR